MNEAKIAKQVRNISEQFRGSAVLYHLSAPLDGHKYVIANALGSWKGPETVIWPSNRRGQVKAWKPVFTAPYYDVKQIMRDVGYTVVEK